MAAPSRQAKSTRVPICRSMRVRETTYRMAERSSLMMRDITVIAITFSFPI